MQLADGWYRGSCGAWGLKNQYGTETKLLAQLEQTIGEDGRILRRETLGRRQGAYLLVTLRAECEEQIGADAPLRIITSDTGR